MRVLLYALATSRGGALRHLTGLLPQLEIADPNNEYVVLVASECPPIGVGAAVEIERRKSPSGGWLGRLLFDVVRLPSLLRRKKYDVVVSLSNFGPIWSPIPHILFQRNALYFCPKYFESLPWKQRIGIRLRRRLAAASMRRAKFIVSPSRSMADMIRVTCPAVSGDRLRVLYHGFDAKALDAGLVSHDEDPLGDDSGVLRLLYPTHAGEHKGFYVLFDALALLKRRGVRFRMYATVSHPDGVGVRGYELRVEALGLQEEVRLLGPVPQERIGALYRAAHLMVYPSLCESFGFSMVEAMGYGLPIVAADTAVNREICGSAALFYGARDPLQAADAIEHAMKAEVREDLRRLGTARIESFDWSWARYAREFASMINENRPVQPRARGAS